MLEQIKNFKPYISSIFDEMLYNGFAITPRRNKDDKIYLCKEHLLELLKDSHKCDNLAELKAITKCSSEVNRIYIKEKKVIAYNDYLKRFLYINTRILKILQSLLPNLQKYKTYGDDKFFTKFSIITETEKEAKILIHFNTIKNKCCIYNLVGSKLFHPTLIINSVIEDSLLETIPDLLQNLEPVDPIVTDYYLSVIDLRDLLYYSEIIEPNKSKSPFKPAYKLNIACINNKKVSDECLSMTEIINENWANPARRYSTITDFSSDKVLNTILQFLDTYDFDITTLCDKIVTTIFPRILRGDQ